MVVGLVGQEDCKEDCKDVYIQMIFTSFNIHFPYAQFSVKVVRNGSTITVCDSLRVCWIVVLL